MDYITTAHQAELNASKVMRSWGFIDAKATTGGSDGGIDVRSRKGLAQVKWRGGVAGRPDLQRLQGARGRDTDKVLIFFAASDYSPQAVQYAREVGMALFVYEPTGSVIPKNATARQIMSGGVKRGLTNDDKWFIGVISAALVVSLMLILISLAGAR